MDDAKKKKKSRKSKIKDRSSPVPVTNGLASSPTRVDDSAQEKKRKRDPEPFHKKQKKHKHHSTQNGVENGDSSVNPADNKQAESKDSETPVKAAKPTTNGLETPSLPVASVVNGTETTTSTGKPRKLRGSRIGGKSNMKVGFFVKEEVAKLEAFKVAFCNTHGFSDHKKFDEMIQHSERDGGDWPCPADVCTKSEFWTEIYNLVPDRDRRSLYRFMRRHFQDSTQKPHEWTDEQDKELVSLMSLHKGKWAYVAKLLGRSDDDVTQRWKNQLEHRGKMNRGKWGEEELRSLLDEIQKVWDRVYASDGDAAGKDMYELEEKHLRWGIISDQLGNVRSRQQCADKWRKIRRSVEQMRACGNPDAVYDPIEAVNKRTRWGSGSVTPKSTWLVGDDEDDEGSKGDNGTPAPINGLGISGDVSQVPISEKKPLPEAPASPQPTTEQDSQADNNPEFNSAANSRPNSPEEQQQPAPENAVVPDDEAKAERKAAKKAEKEKRKKERREQSKVDALVAELGESAQKEKSDKKDDKPRKSLIDTNTAGSEAEATLTTSTPLKKKKRKSTAINGVAPDEPKSPESHKKKKKKSTQEIAK
ncbi:uncharacterized protein N7484_000658 [Penicillium longicatenatum]|uniref:uncharacterized protein n=1 Tax=Penicillium longicatenatum TaxID=1561947 RepID=UPI0025490298|nr:uncharacterized protein N7484_000658 [Penicillium longicatenatum]KAJ5661286.1 hypothetical protein N7484_000658 [Penicillium longicatenatum]